MPKKNPPGRVVRVCVYIDRDPVETEVYFVPGLRGGVDVPWPAFWEVRWFTDDTSGIITAKPTLPPGEEPASPCQLFGG